MNKTAAALHILVKEEKNKLRGVPSGKKAFES